MFAVNGNKVKTFNERGGRADGPRGIEDLQDAIAPIHGSDRIEDFEFGDGGIVVAEQVKEETVRGRP